MWFEAIDSIFTWQQYLEFLLRVVVSCICGGVIGLERSRRLKEAGIRTHVIVACASAVMMIVSKYAFVDLLGSGATAAEAGIKGADASRIASQVVTGVSFLGAGVIFKNGSSIKGLTTAAGIWAISGVGLAIGAGMYGVGVFATLIIYIFQLVMHKFSIGHEIYEVHRITVTVHQMEDFTTIFQNQIKKWRGVIQESKMKKNAEKGTITYSYLVKAPTNLVTIEEINAFAMAHEEIVGAEKLLLG
jgi:putative Mg2+ transporter-C (MgtC) family protein